MYDGNIFDPNDQSNDCFIYSPINLPTTSQNNVVFIFFVCCQDLRYFVNSSTTGFLFFFAKKCYILSNRLWSYPSKSVIKLTQRPTKLREHVNDITKKASSMDIRIPTLSTGCRKNIAQLRPIMGYSSIIYISLHYIRSK